ncbi:MAG: NAD(P)/FAD-dependent oxidoreductase, partial [Myxococcales bacterium]
MSVSVVVIGAGMVGHRFTEELMRHDLERRFEVTMVGAEEHLPYNRILLSDVLASRAREDAITLPRTDERVRLLTGVAVTSIDRPGRTVALGDGSTLAYDVLVLATGARANLPPIPGIVESPQVRVLRTLDDCREIATAATSARAALVLGGGILGLEAACGLRRRGVPVLVVDLDEHLMATQLPAGPAEVLHEQLADLDIDVITGSSVAEVISIEGRLVAARLTDDSLVVTDLMVVSCGIRAETELAVEAGLEVERGVVVDSSMATKDPRIFAIGDCAQPPTGMTGLLVPGWRQAEALADGLIRGVPAEVDVPAAEALKLKAVGADLVRAGSPDADRVITVHDPGGRRHVSLAVTGERLIGFTCVGAPDLAASLTLAHERRTPLPVDPLSLLSPAARTEEASPLRMPNSTTLCRCNNVS